VTNGRGFASPDLIGKGLLLARDLHLVYTAALIVPYFVAVRTMLHMKSHDVFMMLLSERSCFSSDESALIGTVRSVDFRDRGQNRSGGQVGSNVS
jgi:hypothetical protein